MDFVTESFLWQAGIIAIVTFAMAIWTSVHDRKERFTLKDLKEAIQIAAILILVFAFISGGKGCHSSGGSGDENCQPSPHGLVCN